MTRAFEVAQVSSSFIGGTYEVSKASASHPDGSYALGAFLIDLFFDPEKVILLYAVPGMLVVVLLSLERRDPSA